MILTASSKDPSSVPRNHIDVSQPPLTPVPEDLIPSSGFNQYLHAAVHIHAKKRKRKRKNRKEGRKEEKKNSYHQAYCFLCLRPSSCLSPHMPSTHSCPYSCHIPQRALLGSLGEAPSYCFVCVLALMSADTMILALFPMIPEQGFAPKRRQTYLSSELPGPSAQEVLRKRSPQSLTWIGYYLVCC